MPAKQSQEMKDALELVKSGMKVREAAKLTGLWYTSIYASIRESKRVAEKQQNKSK